MQLETFFLQDAQGREATAASRPLNTRAGCEAHCEARQIKAQWNVALKSHPA